MLLSSHYEATRSVRGAARFILVDPLELVRRLALAGVYNLQKVPVARVLGSMHDHAPGDVTGARHQIRVVHVTQELQRPAPGLLEELVVELLGLFGLLLTVAVHEGLELLGVGLTLPG